MFPLFHCPSVLSCSVGSRAASYAPKSTRTCLLSCRAAETQSSNVWRSCCFHTWWVCFESCCTIQGADCFIKFTDLWVWLLELVCDKEEPPVAEDPMHKLKEAIGKAMPEQIACFRETCQDQVKTSKWVQCVWFWKIKTLNIYCQSGSIRILI